MERSVFPGDSNSVYFFDFSQDGFLSGCSHILHNGCVWSDHHQEYEYQACEKELNPSS
jgi:hypothetical protein